ncbi:MAG: hypothetical protein EOP06_02330 [Proteobacteria bacterium]|nr:MAG: hypothetical protein EOP06_02330 [Pseudomonadota bacterium]
MIRYGQKFSRAAEEPELMDEDLGVEIVSHCIDRQRNSFWTSVAKTLGDPTEVSTEGPLEGLHVYLQALRAAGITKAKKELPAGLNYTCRQIIDSEAAALVCRHYFHQEEDDYFFFLEEHEIYDSDEAAYSHLYSKAKRALGL